MQSTARVTVVLMEQKRHSAQYRPDYGLRVSGAQSSAIGLGLHDLLATIIARRADMVAHVHLACRRLDRERRIGQKIMRPMHATFRRGLLVLLNCHGYCSL